MIRYYYVSFERTAEEELEIVLFCYKFSKSAPNKYEHIQMPSKTCFYFLPCSTKANTGQEDKHTSKG